MSRILGITLSCVLACGAYAASGNPLDGLQTLKAGVAQRASTSDPNWVNGNADARPIAPNATLVLADLKGPGMITHLWNTIAANERGYSRLLVLRIYWDGETAPSVECPIGDFFVIGHGMDVPFQSLPVAVSSDGRARNCYWPMPFRKSARVTVTNEGRKPIGAFYSYVDWHKLPRVGRDEAYFHASYRQEFPTVMGRNYKLADIEGRGHYVGTVLSVHQLTASWWGEGDDFFFVDGEKEPSLRGTGSEDYFCDAWGLRKMFNPYYGAPVMTGYDAGAVTTVYRWHIADPVPFTKSLYVEIEHKGVTFSEDGKVKSGFEERSDDFSSVAFWYQVEPHKAYEPLPPAYDRLNVDYTKTIEVESGIANCKVTAGQVTVQTGMWSGEGQIFWQATAPDQSITIPFDLKTALKGSLTLILTYSYDYGIYQFELDGKPLGAPVDMYNPDVVVVEKNMGQVDLAAGAHVLTVKNVGKNTASKGYFFGLDSILPGR